MFPFSLFLGAAASTAIFSAITIILCFVPYPQKTLDFLSTSPLPTSTALYGYGYGYTTSDTTSSVYDAGYQGYSYATPSAQLYTTASTDSYGDSYILTQTSYIYPDATSTFDDFMKSTATLQAFPATRRSEYVSASHERRQAATITSASTSSSTSSAPILTPTSTLISQTTVGPIYAIWLLIVCVFLLVQSASLLVYTVIKRRKLHREGRINVDEGVVQPLTRNIEVSSPGTPAAHYNNALQPAQVSRSEGQSQPQQSFAQPATTPGQEAQGIQQSQQRTPRTPRLTIACARCHFACLIILALLLLVPIGLLMNVAIAWHNVGKSGVSGFASSPFILGGGNDGGSGSYALGAYLASGGCNATALGSATYFNGDYLNPCDGRSGLYDDSSDYNIAASDKTPKDLAFYASPLIAVLIFCWFLLVACLILAIGVCAMRGPRTKKRKRKDVEKELELMRLRIDEQDRMRLMWMQHQQQQQRHGLYAGYFGHEQSAEPPQSSHQHMLPQVYPQHPQAQQQQPPSQIQQLSSSPQGGEMQQVGSASFTTRQAEAQEWTETAQSNREAGPSNTGREISYPTHTQSMHQQGGSESLTAANGPLAANQAFSKGNEKGKARAVED